jgi:hypothetical protein
MLNSSGRIYIAPESDFIPHLFGKSPASTLSQERVASLLQEVFATDRFPQEWQGDPPKAEVFAQAMPDSTPAAFLETLYGAYAGQYGAARWGDKTPIYTSYIDLIHQILPETQFVHIIRDGRDVALSMLDKWGEREFHVDIFFTARNWVRRIKQARKSGARLGPELYYEMRYESLVQDPEAELQALCRFLKEPYVPEMAQPHLLGSQSIEPGSWNDPIRRPPNTSRIERWRQVMPLEDQRLFQAIAGSLLADLGYEVVNPGSMPVPEVARLAALGLKYATLQTGRRILQAAGLFPPI